MSFSTLHRTSLSGKVSHLHPSCNKNSARQQKENPTKCFLSQLSFKVFVLLYICFWFPECSPGLTYNFYMTPDSHEIFLAGWLESSPSVFSCASLLGFSLAFLNLVYLLTLVSPWFSDAACSLSGWGKVLQGTERPRVWKREKEPSE